MLRDNKQQWSALVAALLLQFCAGSMYLFGTYSERLKEVLFYGDEQAQRKLQTMALVGNLALFMPLPGFFYDADLRIASVRVVGGPRATAVVGMVFTFVGYFGLHLIAGGWNPGLAAGCVFVGMWGHGASYFDATAVTLGVKNMPMHRGYVVGLLKAFVGLAGSLITQVKFALFENDDGRDYLLFMAIFCSLCALPGLPFMVETDPLPVNRDAKRRFVVSYGFISVLALLMLAAGLCRTLGDFSQAAEIIVLAVSVVFVILLYVFLLVPILPRQDGAHEEDPVEVVPEATPASEQSQQLSEPLLQAADINDIPPKDPNIGGTPTQEEKPSVAEPGNLERAAAPVEEDEKPTVAMRTLNFWLLFIALGLGTGGGLTMINNAAQIAKAKGGTASEGAVASSMLYVCNSFGRLSLAALGEVLHARRAPRALAFSVTLFLHAGAHLILAIPGKAVMYPGFCLAGFSYGGMQAVFPPVVSELHGVRYFASNYMSMFFSPSIGSLIFSTLIATAVFEKHQERDDDADSSTYRDYVCVGEDCFFITHVIIAVSCVVAFFICLYLAHRVKHRQQLRNTPEEPPSPVTDALPKTISDPSAPHRPTVDDRHQVLRREGYALPH
eukprot:Hpha_TRINITY_DN812_c0_g1::TRINITY_DN812_c0_g1_i1::g.195039::m.195039